MPSFKCSDIGMECGHEMSAPNEAELEKKIAEHARQVHGIRNIPPDMWIQIKEQIHC